MGWGPQLNKCILLPDWTQCHLPLHAPAATRVTVVIIPSPTLDPRTMSQNIHPSLSCLYQVSVTAWRSLTTTLPPLALHSHLSLCPDVIPTQVHVNTVKDVPPGTRVARGTKHPSQEAQVSKGWQQPDWCLPERGEVPWHPQCHREISNESMQNHIIWGK